MPKSGTATYNGSIRGGYLDTGGAVHDDLGGTVSLNANFNTQKIDGSFNFTSGGTSVGSATMTGVDIVGHEIENGTLTGNIVGSLATGHADGKFYGPTANEVGGEVIFESANAAIIGVYGAKQ